MDEQRNREEEQEEEEEQDDRCLRRRCGNCGVSCGADDCDRAYSCHLCTGCSQRRCCKTCRRYLPDVCYNSEQQKTFRVSLFRLTFKSLLLLQLLTYYFSIFDSAPVSDLNKLNCKPLGGTVFCHRHA